MYSFVRQIRRYNLILHRSAIYEEHTHRYCIERRLHCKLRYRLQIRWQKHQILMSSSC